MPTKKVKTPIKEAQLDLNAVALILTVLDKEAHNTQYYMRMTPQPDEGYLQSLKHASSVLTSNISPKAVDKFVEVNPHLSHLFNLEVDNSRPLVAWTKKQAGRSE
ncbi:hypothetical protein [Microviridae sp.]|nr:hypothetical protein [Microviridae sp.]